MKLQATVGRILLSVVCVAAFATLAEAQATRTWVSGVGDDVNPCSRTAPCKTFAGAISKTAANGVISVLDPGGFGAVTITKNITLDGEGTLGSILASLVNGIIINGANLKVTIRNIHIDGAANGLNGIQVPNSATNVRVHVENVKIAGFTGNGINFQPTGGQLFVNDTTIQRTANAVFVNNGRATLERVTMANNSKGVLAGNLAIVTVRNSEATDNGEGFASTSASGVVNLQNVLSTNNQFGISAGGGSVFRLSNCGVLSNSNTGLFNGGGGSQIISLGGNSVQGNTVADGTFTSTIPPS